MSTLVIVVSHVALSKAANKQLQGRKAGQSATRRVLSPGLPGDAPSTHS